MDKTIGTKVKTKVETLPSQNTALGRQKGNHRVVLNLDVNTRDTASYTSQDFIVYSGPDQDKAERIAADLVEPPYEIKVWCNWYSEKLRRIRHQLNNVLVVEPNSPAEQALYELYGCRTFDL